MADMLRDCYIRHNNQAYNLYHYWKSQQRGGIFQGVYDRGLSHLSCRWNCISCCQPAYTLYDFPSIRILVYNRYISCSHPLYHSDYQAVFNFYVPAYNIIVFDFIPLCPRNSACRYNSKIRYRISVGWK